VRLAALSVSVCQVGRACRRITIIAASILLKCSLCAFALDPGLDVSQYAHTAWRVSDGFCNGITFAIAQTPDGYLWIGTDSGLRRFDGVRSTPWQPPEGTRLPSTDIRSLHAARDGRLWIGTTRGLASWKDDRLTQYPELDGQKIEALLEDREGTLWAGSSARSVGRLCAVQSGKTECHGADGLFGSGVTALYEDSAGGLWAGAPTGLWKWKPGPPKVYPMPDPEKDINALTESDDGGILVAQDAGITKLRNGKTEAFPLPAGLAFQPGRLFRDRHGALWIGAIVDGGLIHVHQGRVDLFNRSDGLSGNTVSAFLEDHEGSVWVVTLDGVDRFREYAVTTFSIQQGLSSQDVASVVIAKDGTIWMATDNGLDRWRNGEVTVYRKRRSPPPVTWGASAGLAARRAPHSSVVREVADAGLPFDSVDSLFGDSRGQLWVATPTGVAIFGSDRFLPVPSVPPGTVFSFAEDRAGAVWLSHRDGLFRLLEARVVERIPWAKLGRGEPATDLLRDDVQDGLWIKFRDGHVDHFKEGRLTPTYTTGEGLGSLYFDAKGTLWATTEEGLSRLENGRALTLTTRNGLPCNTVHWMMEGDAGSVWLDLACGLLRTTRSELDAWASNPQSTIHATVFDRVDGVRSQQFRHGYSEIVAKSGDGKIWFLPLGGISVIDPHRLPANTLVPPVVIEQITADRKAYDAASGLRLPPHVRDLQIDYTGLSFVAPEKNHFRVMLEGRDRDWQDVGTRRQAFYTDLDPGSYRFRVKGSNNAGVWNEEGASLEFSVAPAYYETSWFRAALASVFALLLWIGYRVRVGVIERHQAQITALNERLMKAQEQERMRIAGELHDGVDAKADVASVQQKLIELGGEVRQLSHDLHPAAFKESGLPATLRAYCAEFSQARGIPVTCEADESGSDLSRGSALALYRIAQEALGNAAKHAAPTRIEVRLTRTESDAVLTVTDDGAGVDTVGGTGGLGLVSMRERARQLGGMFEFISKRGRGTTVSVRVPFRPVSTPS
jgi:ligand-binding sensor domain-containing protein